MSSHNPETVMTVTITPNTAAFTESVARSFDLDKLDAAHLGYVPFSVRYGWRKISDFARFTPQWPGEPGRLWYLVAHPKGTQQ